VGLREIFVVLETNLPVEQDQVTFWKHCFKGTQD